MYTVFAIDQGFSRVDTLKCRWQSLSSSTESPFSENGQCPSWPTGAGASRRVASMLGQGLHVACLSSRWKPRLGTLSASRHFPLSPSPRAAPRHSSPPPLPAERRRHRASKPPRKRVAPSACSLAVTSSTSSTSQPGQSSLGKGVFAVLPHRSHGGSSPELALHAASCPRALSTLPLARARS